MQLPPKKRKLHWLQENEFELPGSAAPPAKSGGATADGQKRRRKRKRKRKREQHEDAVQSHPCPQYIFGRRKGPWGRYALRGGTLGSGKFETLSECTDLATGDRLACKTIRKRRESSEAQVQDLRNEVELLLRLEGHDNVAQLRGVVEDEDVVHLVMDRCDGGELFREIERRRRFSEPDAAAIFSVIVKAVAFCHSREVIHRDLKPENILLTRKLKEDTPLW